MEDYKEKLEAARNWLKIAKEQQNEIGVKILENLFPELAESEDEKIRKEILEYVKRMEGQTIQRLKYESWISWLEKQKVTNDDAEQEKNNFVSGKFLYCRCSFNEFKEGESYWLEYIGNDTYIGRSDNVLNQQFHITPRLLYTWFIEQHPCIKVEEQKQVERSDEDEKAIRLLKKLIDNNEILSKKDTNVCYAWLEKQKEHKPVKLNEEDEKIRKELLEYLQRCVKCNPLTENTEKIMKNSISWLESFKNRCVPQPTQECSEEDIDFLISVIDKNLNDGVYGFDKENRYKFVDKNCIIRMLKSHKPQPKQEWSEEDERNLNSIISYFVINCYAHKTDLDNTEFKMWEKYCNWLKSIKPKPKQEWSIENASEGDFLSCKFTSDGCTWEKIVIFKSLNEFGVEGYGMTLKDGKLWFSDEMIPYYSKTWTRTLTPATKEQVENFMKNICEYNSQVKTHWKPSKEQMEALRIAAYEPYKNWNEQLQSLYQDLQKL